MMTFLAIVVIVYCFVTMFLAIGHEEYACAIACGLFGAATLGVLCYV